MQKDANRGRRLVEEQSGLEWAYERGGGGAYTPTSRCRVHGSMAAWQGGGGQARQSANEGSARILSGLKACLSDPEKKAVEQLPLSSLRALPPT